MKPEVAVALVLAAVAAAGVVYLVTRPPPAAPAPTPPPSGGRKGPVNQIVSGLGDVIGGVVDVFV